MRDVPLQLLRVFEACGRYQSYTGAAKELNVTHSAVSQQMRRLEETLGVKLFAREHDRMALTAAGEKLLDRVSPALLELRAATTAVRTETARPYVRLTTIPSLATYWLLPRVAHFQSTHSAFVSIDTSIGLQSLSSNMFDLAIRHGRGHWAGCDSEKLFDEELILVCSPSYREGKLPREPEDLEGHSLIDYRGNQEWRHWAAKTGFDRLRLDAATTVSDAAQMIGAAVAGHGIAIGRSAIVLEHLRRGELVPLFDIRARAEFSYYLVTPTAVELAPHVVSFINWLRTEAEQTNLDLQALKSSAEGS